MGQTIDTPEAAMTLVRRMLRMAEVARVMGDLRTASTLQTMADRIFRGAQAGHVPEDAVREARRLAA